MRVLFGLMHNPDAFANCAGLKNQIHTKLGSYIIIDLLPLKRDKPNTIGLTAEGSYSPMEDADNFFNRRPCLCVS